MAYASTSRTVSISMSRARYLNCLTWTEIGSGRGHQRALASLGQILTAVEAHGRIQNTEISGCIGKLVQLTFNYLSLSYYDTAWTMILVATDVTRSGRRHRMETNAPITATATQGVL